MKPQRAASERAGKAMTLVESLQQRFVSGLEKLGETSFSSAVWLRDAGRHGGGRRFGAADTAILGRASVNVSQVHYDDEPDRKLGSATAISTIVHPAHPLAPSVHIHVSWTEQKEGRGYWRIMADLNPAISANSDRLLFCEALRDAAPGLMDEAAEQGDRYFFIPTLNRHRGVIHFYLENYNSGDFAVDYALATDIGEAAIDTYLTILKHALQDVTQPTDEQKAAQLAYHTLYFFQVLTLDRGTTTGLLVHDQNDVGILGSLPPRIDKNLLASWRWRMPEPQDQLLDQLLAALPNQGICVVNDEAKQRLADALRAHYRSHPEALAMQATGGTTPPTIDNHR